MKPAGVYSQALWFLLSPSEHDLIIFDFAGCLTSDVHGSAQYLWVQRPVIEHKAVLVDNFALWDLAKPL